MDVSEIRRSNARYLAASEKNRAAFAERIGKSTSQVNNWIGPNPKKNIGPDNARLIEKRYGKPHGWLDNIHPEVKKDAKIVSLNKTRGDTVKLEFLETVSFSMGSGMAATQDEYQIKSFETTRKWVSS